MKVLVMIALICSRLSVSGQMLMPPGWQYDVVDFKTAKLKIVDEKSKKILWDGYKGSEISIFDATNTKPVINIDIPDRFYLKEADVTNIKYSYEDGLETITYLAIQGKKMASVYFTYKIESQKIENIVVAASDNYLGKDFKVITMILYEIK